MARDTMPGFLLPLMFSTLGYRSGHTQRLFLRPATADEIAETLSFALLYQAANECTMLARITAKRLKQHPEASGFVLMKRPPRAAPTTGGMPPGRGRDAD